MERENWFRVYFINSNEERTEKLWRAQGEDCWQGTGRVIIKNKGCGERDSKEQCTFDRLLRWLAAVGTQG